MTIAQKEIFGPVLVAIPFDDDDDAVRIANDSEYGLSGHGHVRLTRVERSRSQGGSGPGTMGVNGGIWYGADAPFGGYKASGVGRQNGDEGFEQYLETKTYGGSALSESAVENALAAHRPMPELGPWNRPFWTGGQDGELTDPAVQRVR